MRGTSLVSLTCALMTLAPAGWSAEPSAETRYEFAQVQMGVSFTIILYAPNETLANRASDAAFRRIEQLNGIMSDYDADSELMRLCRTAGSGQAVRVSPELAYVLGKSLDLSRQSGGAFDVTVGPVVRLWRRARRQKRLPDADRLATALEAVGYEAVVLDRCAREVRLTRPGMRLDLGGIAKGYAADEAMKVLRAHGILRALVDGSGDIAVGQAPPDKAAWRIGIAPLDAAASPSRYLLLEKAAVATSGDLWQHIEIDGRRYSHIVDPTTGLGLTESSSVTIVAPDCLTADSLASAVSVLGQKKGLALVAKNAGAAALIVRREGDKLKTHQSSDFEAHVDMAQTSGF